MFEKFLSGVLTIWEWSCMAGHLGGHDFWWHSNSNADTDHSNDTMWLGKGGIVLLLHDKQAIANSNSLALSILTKLKDLTINYIPISIYSVYMHVLIFCFNGILQEEKACFRVSKWSKSNSNGNLEASN